MKKLTDGRRTPSDGNTSHDPLGKIGWVDNQTKLFFYLGHTVQGSNFNSARAIQT